MNGGGEARGDERAGMDLWREEVAEEEFIADPTQTFMLVGGAGKKSWEAELSREGWQGTARDLGGGG